MHNCRPHVRQAVIDLLTQPRVHVVTLAPHTPNIVHVLDVTLRILIKRGGQYHLRFKTSKGTADFVFQTDKDFRSTMIDTNIWRAFRRIGLEFHDVGDVQHILFNEITLRQSPRFQEPSVIDCAPENLSTRGREAKFHWTNKPESTTFRSVCSILSEGT
jgi:hypothetical protein